MFPICISYTTCISTCYHHVKLLDLHFNPHHTRTAIPMICPDKVTSSSLFQQPFHILKLPQTCSATSGHFHLPPNYEDHMVTMHISLERANPIQSTSQPQIFVFGNTLIATWLQATCRNWQMCPKSPLHSSTSTWLARVNLFYHLRSTKIWKNETVLDVNS